MVITLDVGTSSTRAAAWDDAGHAVADRFHQVRHDPTVGPDGGVEHDPERLLEAVVACLDAVLHVRGPADVRAVGVATFWHGLVGFDGAGRPVTPVYMWADTRSARDAQLLRTALDEVGLHAMTGCHLHSSYWPAKLRWLAREHPESVNRVARWGSFGEYVELQLFGEAATSLSMASGTGLLDQERLTWSPAALAAAGVDSSVMFRLCDRDEPRRGLRPQWARRWPALRGVPWFPAVGDGAAGNVGSGCIDPARVALNLGTSVALRMVTPRPEPPPRGLWRYRLDRRLSLVGGALSEGGNVYAWCRDILRLPGGAEIETALAEQPPDGHGLTVLPFLAGERAPGWRGERRGAIVGLGLDTTPLDIVRAVLEAVAHRIVLVHERLAPLLPAEHAIVASGGAAGRSRAWPGIIASALGRPVGISVEEEATSRGAALLALSAVGALPDLAAAAAVPLGEVVQPDMAHHARLRAALARHRDLDARLA
jgi:gluconokinase